MCLFVLDRKEIYPIALHQKGCRLQSFNMVSSISSRRLLMVTVHLKCFKSMVLKKIFTQILLTLDRRLIYVLLSFL